MFGFYFIILHSDYWYEPLGESSLDFEDTYVAADEFAKPANTYYVEETEAAQPSGLFSVQGGVGLGPFKISGGIGAGR